jgi:hypothetical protein
VLRPICGIVPQSYNLACGGREVGVWGERGWKLLLCIMFACEACIGFFSLAWRLHYGLAFHPML